ncbi:MAG: YqgE/AlgH family protein [Verrucomicrobia bacterium]|nr:YqgE/AlgH family protein [Verrucomicrobiota bacterium]
MRLEGEEKFSIGGKLLFAHPSLKDPHFRRTILFISSHEEAEGAFGVVVNRPMHQRLADLVAEPAFPGLADVPVYEGGPVSSDELILMAFLDGQAGVPGAFQVPVSLGDAEEILREGRGFVRAFRGYAGWSAGQLEGELGQNAWFVKDMDAELLAGEPDQKSWLGFMKLKGPAYYLLALAPDDPSLN